MKIIFFGINIPKFQTLCLETHHSRGTKSGGETTQKHSLTLCYSSHVSRTSCLFFPPLVALITTEMMNCIEKTKRLSILSVGFLVIIITIFNWGYCPNLIKYCWRCSLGDQLWGRHVLQWSGGSQCAGCFLHQGKKYQIFSMYHHKNFHIWNPGCWCFKYLPGCSIAQKQKSVSKYHSGF